MNINLPLWAKGRKHNNNKHKKDKQAEKNMQLKMAESGLHLRKLSQN